jgi:hypothetical protein
MLWGKRRRRREEDEDTDMSGWKSLPLPMGCETKAVLFLLNNIIIESQTI